MYLAHIDTQRRQTVPPATTRSSAEPETANRACRNNLEACKLLPTPSRSNGRPHLRRQHTHRTCHKAVMHVRDEPSPRRYVALADHTTSDNMCTQRPMITRAPPSPVTTITAKDIMHTTGPCQNDWTTLLPQRALPDGHWQQSHVSEQPPPATTRPPTCQPQRPPPTTTRAPQVPATTTSTKNNRRTTRPCHDVQRQRKQAHQPPHPQLPTSTTKQALPAPATMITARSNTTTPIPATMTTNNTRTTQITRTCHKNNKKQRPIRLNDEGIQTKGSYNHGPNKKYCREYCSVGVNQINRHIDAGKIKLSIFQNCFLPKSYDHWLLIGYHVLNFCLCKKRVSRVVV